MGRGSLRSPVHPTHALSDRASQGAGGRSRLSARKLYPGVIPRLISNRPDCPGNPSWQIVRGVVEHRRTPVKKLIIAAMLAAFSAAIVVPVVIGSDKAVAAQKKKSSMKKEKKKPTGGM
jgi:hypothetical protein